MKRPTGVTVLAILAFIGGALLILAGLAGITGSAIIGSSTTLAGTRAAQVGGSLVIISAVALVLGVLDLVLGVGFLQLRSWAWTLGVGLQIAGILLDVIFVATNNSTIGSQILPIAISGVVIYYLFRPNVKQAFGRS